MKQTPRFTTLLLRSAGIAVIAVGSISFAFAPDAKAFVTDACSTGDSQNPFKAFFKDLKKGDQFQCQDKLFTIGDPKDLKATNTSTKSKGGYLSFEWTEMPPDDLLYTNDLFGIAAFFQPQLSSVSVANGSFEYTVAAGTNFVLKDVTLDSLVGKFTTSKEDTIVKKEVYDIDNGELMATLVSKNGNPEPPPPVSLGGKQEVRIVETWTVQPGDTLNNFQNIFRQESTLTPPDEVPGPLPLLGAGAALGFSRRLRSRLLAARRI